jgi:hypothetical protein
LKAYHKPGDEACPFAGLQLFEQMLTGEAGQAHQATNQILVDLVETLKESDQEGAELLSRRFFDREKMRFIANSLNMSEATAFRRQSQMIERAAALLQARELAARKQRQAVLEKRLDRPTYTQLIGFEDHLKQLLDLLTSSGPPWLVAIEGLGGLGKTSLADAVTRQIIDRRLFDDVGWVSARQHIFTLSGRMQAVETPALTAESLIDELIAQLLPHLPKPETLSSQEAKSLLQTHLDQTRSLIVIDNLETLTDVAELLPLLHKLANPARFLLTSRESFYDEVALFHFRLPQLSQAGALHLIHHEIDTHNLAHLRQASDEDLHQVYRVIGGNPLAIRLVVGQTHVFTLSAILEDLAQARSQTVDELYTFIYWRAWQALDEPTRQLFLAMPLITAEGERLEHLAELSGLAVGAVYTSLQRLVDLNLVNSNGDHQARHYSIHNLTRTFLLEQVLKWQQP